MIVGVLGSGLQLLIVKVELTSYKARTYDYYWITRFLIALYLFLSFFLKNIENSMNIESGSRNYLEGGRGHPIEIVDCDHLACPSVPSS